MGKSNAIKQNESQFSVLKQVIFMEAWKKLKKRPGFVLVILVLVVEEFAKEQASIIGNLLIDYYIVCW